MNFVFRKVILWSFIQFYCYSLWQHEQSQRVGQSAYRRYM